MENDDPGNDRKKRSNEPVSIENMPLALGCILDDVAEIRDKIDALWQHLGMGAAGIKPITIKEAAEYLSVSESKIRKMVVEHSIPHYKRNGKTYFFEKELLEWVKGSRVATIDEEIANFKFGRRRR